MNTAKQCDFLTYKQINEMDAKEYLISKGILEIDEGCANDADNATYISERMVIGWMEEYHQSKLKNHVDLDGVSGRIPKPHGKRIEYANYYIKRYSSQFGLDKEKLSRFMLNFLGDEWMSDPNKYYR